jgi:hypothetical protein
MILIILVSAALLVGFGIGLMVGQNKGNIAAEKWRTTNEITVIKNKAHVVEEDRLQNKVDKLQVEKEEI